MNQLMQWIADSLKGVRLWFVVLPWERAIRTRLGKHTRLYEPGWHLRIPLVDVVLTFNNRLRIAAFPSLTVTTIDGRNVTAAGLVGFRIVDPLSAMLALRQPEATCSALAMGEIAAYLSARRLDQVSASAAALAATTAVSAQAPGICVDFVRLVDFASVRTYRLLQEQWRPGTNTDREL